MSVSQQLIESISDDLGIKRGIGESAADWITRVVYSAIAKNAYCSLWDHYEDDTSIIHFKKRCHEQLFSYTRIYPELKAIISSSEIAKEYVEYVYHLYLKSGFLLHKKKHITNSKQRVITINDCSLVRSPEPGVD